MSIDEKIFIDVSNLPEIKAKIPAEDFIDSQFDIDYEVKTSAVLLILSTPHSGSTLLCDFLRRNGGKT